LIPSERIAVVHDNETGVISSPLIQSFEELLTGNFLTVDDCTSFGCDIHPVVTTLLQLFAEVEV
jgi:hypothetical protein